MKEEDVVDLTNRYVALAVKYSDLVDRYWDLKQAILDPENQPSQFGTVLARMGSADV
jgi:hypothetical protein